jgi:endonuclease/exonuclease/phosphatase family metal-dependent hydrolase
MRAFWVSVLVGGCSGGLGPAHPWVPAEEVGAPYRVEIGAAPVPRVAGDALRVVTFNVHLGEDVEALAAAIEGDAEVAAFDVLLVQEIEAYPGDRRAARLAERLGVGYVYAPARVEGEGTHGLAILSGLELTGVQVMELPFADLGFHSRRRIALAADVGGVRVVNVHLDTRINAGERVEQLRPAVVGLPEIAVVAGDFNTNPFVWAGSVVPVAPASTTGAGDQAAVVDDFMGELGFAGGVDEPTQQAGPLELRLDAIYVRGVAAGEAHVARGVDGSDHWPLWIDLDIQSRRFDY